MGKTSSKVKDRYNEKAYDVIMLRPKKGEKFEIQAAADQAGLSLNAYILSAVKEKMNGGKA